MISVNFAGTDVAEQYWPAYYSNANGLWGTWYDSAACDEAIEASAVRN